MTDYSQTAIEQALAAGDAPKPLPFILAGPLVRRAEPNGVWFWFACSREITSCTPRITVYDSKGNINDTLANEGGWAPLATPELRVARLGERLWVALVKAKPRGRPFTRGWFYGYELTIGTRNFATTLAGQGLDLTYAPFKLPTFMLGNDHGQRFVHGSCRRPGAPGPDAYPAFDAWLRAPQRDPMFSDGRTFTPAADLSRRPASLILTGDQIYADDVAVPLFKAVQRLARDVFGYVERLPTQDGRSTVSVDEFLVPPRAGAAPPAGANTRKALTSRGRSPIGFTTDDGEAHLLSFPEFAAMYLLVLNEQLCIDYGVEDGTDAELRGFPAAVGASRRVLANTVTYMVFDDHEITDDWNLDLEWVTKTTNPMARRVIANGLAAYWAFQGWGNDPDAFEPLKSAITAHLDATRGARGTPAAPAAAFDRNLFAQHWSFVAPTSPPAMCVDSRTSRAFPLGKSAVLSGERVWPHMRRLAQRHGLRKGAPLLLVLPTPLLAHRSMVHVQEEEYPYPVKRYEGDYELYINNPVQRADLIRELRAQLDPPAIVIFSGDVHHGSVINGLYVGGPNRKAIDAQKGTWGIRVAQVTSSPIKNVKKKAFVDKIWGITDPGNVGESVIPQFETLYNEPPNKETLGVRADAVNLSGPLGRRTFVWENHLCVVDIPEATDGDVRVLFVGNKDGIVKTATATVSTKHDPKTFVPSPTTLMRQRPWYLRPFEEEATPEPVALAAAVGGPPAAYEDTAIEDAMGISRAASGGSVRPAAPPPHPPPPPAPRPATDAVAVREHIKTTAKARAKTRRSVPAGSKFYKRLTDFYLKDYLAAPSAAKGAAAAEAKIGKSFAGPATAGDRWEQGALKLWNKQAIPRFARMLRPQLPAELAAATDILSRANRAHLPVIDVPQLIGAVNTGLDFDADVKGGGKNVSQLMHWGTGVKYSSIDKLTMRELFIAYELWHLEAWDVFGEDPINDLIAEEAGRILGAQLRAAAITRANLQAKLDEGFAEARAWVGTLLRPRLADLDRWTLAEAQPLARIWYGHQGNWEIWGKDTISSLLKGGASVDAVKRSSLAERITEIYTLIYEADAWEAAHGRIDNGSFIPKLLKGDFDSTFDKLAKDDADRLRAAGFALAVETPVTSLELPIDAYRTDPSGTACAKGPQPGARALMLELSRRFGGRGEIFNCRPVRGGSRLSLHGEGRAVDWYRNANDPAQLAEAGRIIDWLMAADSAGNQHALARRLGVQEIIWNRRIWTARRQAEGWRPYTGTNPHTDHLHIGLNWPGARLQTTYWATHGVYANAADIDAHFRARTGRPFIDWFRATLAGKAPWAGATIRDDADTRRRFTQVWNGIPQMFGSPTISLEQFVALQGVFVKELGGGMAPITERMGTAGHPGMAYLFDSFGGKASYNKAPNRNARVCFNDADFNDAHGTLEPGPRLANTTNAAWGGQTWPAGEPTDMATAPYIAQADFCKFRGRGLIQTTWRDAYQRVAEWIRAYTGTNAKVLEYRRRWTGQDVQRVLTRSSNGDWDDLFRNSDYVVPWAGVRLHSQSKGNYLAISPEPSVRAGKAQGSFWNMGKKVNGGTAYADNLRDRCIKLLTALEAATPPSTPATLALEGGPPPASQLTWDGATPEQLAFKRRVYDTQIRRSARVRGFVANVPNAELGPIEGGHRARTAAAEACVRLLADARAAAGANAKIGVVSSYRSVTQQFTNWNALFARYYADTAAERRKAPGGEHGEQAAEVLARHIGGILAAPGYSLHNDGRAIDFSTVEGGRTLGASTRQRQAWRGSWLFRWLSDNAPGYGFHQNLSIDEPWHWEYRAPSGGAMALGTIAAGEADVASVPLLSEHHDTGPDMILRWNEIADLSRGVDVVVHLHGFSSNRHLNLRTVKLPVSGLDFRPSGAPAGMPAHPAWTGRGRPTLLVLPRGRARSGHPAAYDFPALVRAGAFGQLVEAALREFESRTGAGRRVEPRRILLTAHSGGGAALNRILDRTNGTSYDPHEVHVFDALYGDAAGLRAWAARRLQRDIDQLRTGVPDAQAYLSTLGSALRILYLHGSERQTTRPSSLGVQAVADGLIPAGTPYTALLKRRYRTEVARVGHSTIAYWYGGRLLADVTAEVMGP